MGCIFKTHHFLIGLSIDGLSAVHNRYRISGNSNPTFEKVVKALNLLQEYGVEFNTLTVINDQNWQKKRNLFSTQTAWFDLYAVYSYR